MTLMTLKGPARRAVPLLLAGGLALLAGACAAPQPSSGTAPVSAPVQAGQPLTLQGRLVLRGNAPHEQPVLQTASGQLWQLQGLSAGQIAQWQRQNVQVQGLPGPAPAAGAAPSMVPSTLQVQSIQAQP